MPSKFLFANLPFARQTARLPSPLQTQKRVGSYDRFSNESGKINDNQPVSYGCTEAGLSACSLIELRAFLFRRALFMFSLTLSSLTLLDTKKIFLMPLKQFLFTTLIVISLQAHAQTLSFSPEHPQAGQMVSVTYTPSDLLTTSSEPLKVVYYKIGDKGYFGFDANVIKSGKSYVFTIPMDTADRLVMLGISNGDQMDNNKDSGYLIPLYQGEELLKGTDYYIGQFYNGFGRNVGVDPDPAKALEYMDREYANYPDEKDKTIVPYLYTYKSVHPESADKEVQNAIEAALSNGLKDESDYDRLQSLYAINKLTQQSKFINRLKEEKFPNGKWTIAQTLQKYTGEKDQQKKEAMWDVINKNIDNNPDWSYLKPSRSYYQSVLLSQYWQNKDWQGLEKTIVKYGISGSSLASDYNNQAWELQGKGEDLQQASKMSQYAVNWAKNQISKPDEPKPDSYPQSQWKKINERTYAMYADTYAMVQYKLGNYKKGLPYAEDAAIKYNKGQSADENNTYALLASKVYKAKKIVPILEKMVKEGKATSGIKDILKEQYLKKHSAEAYQNYMADLEKTQLEKMLADLKKSMINEKSPSFALKDVDGNVVNVSDLKGKVLVVDFWATWCGPCKASFPGMQKMVTKFKDDPSVKFLFVYTWESGENKEKDARDFISANKYDFHVLMDNENKVVEQFKVSGIPTKFVIDKNGNIRFKSVGFGGSDDGLVQELSAMIDLAKKA